MSLKHAAAPFYWPLSAVYRNVKFQFLFFQAAVEALMRFLPEPVETSPDSNRVAAGLEVPFCSNYDPFLEVFLLLKCAFRGGTGYY